MTARHLAAAAAIVAALVLVVHGRTAGEAGVPVAGIAHAAAPSGSNTPAVARDELIVRFDSTASASERSNARAAVGGQIKRSLPLPGMQLLTLPASASPKAAAARIEHQRGVEYAEPDFTRKALGSVNDPLFPYEWGLNNTGQTVDGVAGTPDADIDAAEAWDVTAGDPSVTVAVVDSGIDATNPDLRDQIKPGFDFVDGDSDPNDMNGHGTHVSGTIAARGDDGTGVVGVSYRSTLMPLRVLDASGSGTVADIISAYDYAASHGVRIVNASLGSDAYSRAERDAIAAAPNTLFVVAAGNGGSDGVGDDVDQSPEYPCDYPLANVICVAATDSSDQLASFSNYGTTNVDVAAPGVSILSDWPSALGSSFAWDDGTSMATPHVSGTAALVASRFPDAGAGALRTAVLDGADQLPSLAGKVAGGRRLNAYGAVTEPAPAPTPAPTTTPATSPTPSPAAVQPSPVAPAPAAAAPAPSPAPPPVIDTTAPVLTVRVARRVRASTLRARGLHVRVSCSEPCRLGASLTIVHKKRAIALPIVHVATRLASAGRRDLTLRPSRRLRSRWVRQLRPGTRLRLELVVRDPAGNKRRVLKTITVAR